MQFENRMQMEIRNGCYQLQFAKKNRTKSLFPTKIKKDTKFPTSRFFQLPVFSNYPLQQHVFRKPSS